MTAMRDSELCALIDRESRNSMGVNDEFAADRQKAQEFYLGEAKGELAPPDVDGRSRVVSKDLMDTVEWAMPALMEALGGADDLVSFRPRSEQDSQGASDATAYINHLIYDENDGFITLHDAIKSCLLTRMGVVKVWCDKSHEDKTETYDGCSMAELQALEQDPEIEVVEVTQGEAIGVPQGMPPELGQTFNVKAKRREDQTQFKCEGVPPEEIRISRDARTQGDLRYVAHEVERTASDLISEGWPADKVKMIPSGQTAEGEAERDGRHEYDGSQDNDDDGDKSQRKITVTEAYIRVDYDGDGIAEYRKIVKAGNYVHENEVTDDHPFAFYTPILMPYKLVGLSLFDLVEDLQRIKTALTRQLLDNAYQVNTPRTEVVEGQVNLDDLLNPRPGGLVRVKTPGAMREIVTPFIGPQALAVIQSVDQTRDTRTGVTEVNSALTSQSLNKGAVGSEGVQAMMAAGAQRIKLIARVLAETGLKRQHMLMLKAVQQYQDRPTQFEVNGRWLTIDPREWAKKFGLKVNVGDDAAKQVANLMMIATMQEKAMQIGLCTPQNAHHTAIRLVKAMGYKDGDQFFSQPNPNPPPPAPDPALQIEQMKQQGAQQLAQVKAQADIQVETMRQQAQDQQSQRELQMQAERDGMKMQNDMQLEQYKAQMQMDVDLQKANIAAQSAREIAQINAQASMYAASQKPQEASPFE